MAVISHENVSREIDRQALFGQKTIDLECKNKPSLQSVVWERTLNLHMVNNQQL